MDFKSIVGNESLKALIGSHIRSKTFSHAYIIEGKRGSGKRTLAREICKALMCQNPSPHLPCGSCRSCKRIEEGYNTDIFFLNRGEKASISVNDVRAMTDTLGYYPDDGDVKVYVIEEADKLTPQAQNALLLSLEEPPSYVVFLLLCEEAKNLLETVRSRAQILKTELFSISFVAEWLKDRPEAQKATDEEITSCAACSQGALGLALSSLSKKGQKISSISDDATKLVDLLCSDSKADAIIYAGSIKYSRAEFEQFFDYAIFAVRDLIGAKCNCKSTTFFADSEAVAKKASRLKMTRLVKIYEELCRAKDDITVNNSQIYAVMTTLAASAF